MRVLVTGSSGFIGSATVRALTAAGHDPVEFDLEHGHDILTDVFPEVDHVIHLAGVLGTDELFDAVDMAIDVNVKGTTRVLDHCRLVGAGFTGITQPDVFPSVYTATRVCASHLAKAWHHTYGVPVSLVRAFNAYGPGQKHGPGHPRKIIPAFATEAWAGEPLIVWGDGEQTVDLVHVDEVARVLVNAADDRYYSGLTGPEVPVYDAGTGMSWTVNEVARRVCEIAGVDPLIQYRPMRRGETPTNIVADRPLCNPTDDRLTEAVEWYKS